MKIIDKEINDSTTYFLPPLGKDSDDVDDPEKSTNNDNGDDRLFPRVTQVQPSSDHQSQRDTDNKTSREALYSSSKINKSDDDEFNFQMIDPTPVTSTVTRYVPFHSSPFMSVSTDSNHCESSHEAANSFNLSMNVNIAEGGKDEDISLSQKDLHSIPPRYLVAGLMILAIWAIAHPITPVLLYMNLQELKRSFAERERREAEVSDTLEPRRSSIEMEIRDVEDGENLMNSGLLAVTQNWSSEKIFYYLKQLITDDPEVSSQDKEIYLTDDFLRKMADYFIHDSRREQLKYLSPRALLEHGKIHERVRRNAIMSTNVKVEVYLDGKKTDPDESKNNYPGICEIDVATT